MQTAKDLLIFTSGQEKGFCGCVGVPTLQM